MRSLVALAVVLALLSGDQLMAQSQRASTVPQDTGSGTYVDAPSVKLSDEERIRRIEQEWPNALSRRDSAWLGQHAAKELVFVDADGSVLSREAYLSVREANPDHARSAENRVDGVYIRGDTGFVYGTSRFDVLNGGKAYSLSFRWTSTYLKQDGTWRVILAQLTPINAHWRDAFATSK